ncbi:protein of unknown function [Streptantibioticus cattleyicolor NRRL 8057 = DSM 46488]|nr:protein of unknown function [Streptantibioticus cattleyicolor NRRL 8057 = DSM 46488]
MPTGFRPDGVPATARLGGHGRRRAGGKTRDPTPAPMIAPTLFPAPRPRPRGRPARPLGDRYLCGRSPARPGDHPR